MAKGKDDYTSKGYAGREIPLYEHDMTREKDVTIDLYMKDGYPCGDVGDDEYEAADIGKGNVVGGSKEFGIHHKFENGIPNEGREDISAEVMKPVHKANVKESVLSNIGDEAPEWSAGASKISPAEMGVHNTFGVK
jgi:hypothetical protein